MICSGLSIFSLKINCIIFTRLGSFILEMFQSHNMLLPTYHLNLDTCLASNFHSLNLTIILPISVRGAVSARDSIEVVGDVTGTSNADDGVVLSKFPKWVTWCDVMISLIILLALLLPLFLMMIKGNSSFIMISSSYSHLTSSYHNYEIDKIIMRISQFWKVSDYSMLMLLLRS